MKSNQTFIYSLKMEIIVYIASDLNDNFHKYNSMFSLLRNDIYYK